MVVEIEQNMSIGKVFVDNLIRNELLMKSYTNVLNSFLQGIFLRRWLDSLMCRKGIYRQCCTILSSSSTMEKITG